MSQLLAHAAFEFDLEDLANVTCRWVERVGERSPSTRRLRQRTSITVAVFTAVLVGLVLWPTLQLPPFPAVGIAVAAGVFAGLTEPERRRHRVRGHVRNVLAENEGPRPHRCEVDLFQDHVRIVQDGTTTSWPWTEAESVSDDRGDIVLELKSSLIVINRCAFASETDQQSFLRLAVELAAAAIPAGSGASASAAT